MATSVNDIARAAGVGRTTVLRALLDKGRIAPATKARILKIAAEMDYRPNMVARSLVSGKTNLVGLLIGPTDSHSNNRYISPMYRILRRAGYGVLVHIAVEGPESELMCANEMICNRVSGVLAQPTVLSGPEPYQQLLSANIPVVMFDRMLDGFRAPQVVSDQYLMGRLATEHLISLGHRRIVYLAMPGSQFLSRERARGFKDAMSNAGIPVEPSSIMEVGWQVESGASAMRNLLRHKNGPPTAIVARHDWVAIGAMNAAMDAGLSVPGDVSIIGVGDMPLADRLAVPLTTVFQPAERIAEVAAGFLIDMLEGRPVEPEPFLVSDLRVIVRASCGPPRSSV